MDFLVFLLVIYVIGCVVLSLGAFDSFQHSDSMWAGFDPQEKLAIIFLWPFVAPYVVGKGLWKLYKRLDTKVRD